MKQAKHQCEAEHLEEGDEDLAAGEAAEHKRKEGGDTGVEDGRPNDTRQSCSWLPPHALCCN